MFFRKLLFILAKISFPMLKRPHFFFVSLLVLGLAACKSPAPQSSTLIRMNPEKDLPGLFEAVQNAHLFPDSKTFPDCIPLASAEEIMTAYAAESKKPGFVLAEFVQTYFKLPETPASGFVSDTSQSPQEHIHTLWPVLTRQSDSAQAGSLLPLPHPFVVPGGRFGEMYYWDSYFTMLGLRESPGQEVVLEQMVDNFAYLIHTYGFIPNGTRTYYLTRSQPPFFALMVDLLAGLKGDEVYKTYLPALQKEHAFWMEGENRLSPSLSDTLHVVRLPDGMVLNRYWDRSDQPRPESFREDVALAEQSGREAAGLYRDLRAACASGWDFSSRWLADKQSLATIHTTEILPPDLNALLFHLEKTITKAAEIQGNTDLAREFDSKAEKRAAAIHRYLFDRKEGYFADYDFRAGKFTEVPSAAMLFPLFFGIATQEEATYTAQKAEQYLLAPGGLVTTPNRTGQQWDSPNGWAPLQLIGVEGLERYEKFELARTVRDRWVDLNVRVYKQTGKMVEKYNVVDGAIEAGGGEYPLQDGFGWTNGVLLYLLNNPSAK